MSLPSIVAVWRSLRPAQWTKNLIVFAPLIFSGRLMDSPSAIRVFLSALFFCMISSAAYLINDILDREKDRVHVQKRQRPLAAGELKPLWGFIASFFLLAVCLSSSFLMNGQLGMILAGYWMLMLAYSLVLKNLFIFDIAIIPAGFILRIKAGAVAIPVPMSPWLIVCTLLLALFLVLGKRRQELEAMKQDAYQHRRVLKSYNLSILNNAFLGTGVLAASCYTLYTFLQGIHPRLLIGTSLFVWIGIARYIQLILFKGRGGDPSHVLLTDYPILINLILWFGALVWILYGR
jgi:4-hydroxybenzoate polyprenyltransferase